MISSLPPLCTWSPACSFLAFKVCSVLTSRYEAIAISSYTNFCGSVRSGQIYINHTNSRKDYKLWQSFYLTKLMEAHSPESNKGNWNSCFISTCKQYNKEKLRSKMSLTAKLNLASATPSAEAPGRESEPALISANFFIPTPKTAEKTDQLTLAARFSRENCKSFS